MGHNAIPEVCQEGGSFTVKNNTAFQFVQVCLIGSCSHTDRPQVQLLSANTETYPRGTSVSLCWFIPVASPFLT